MSLATPLVSPAASHFRARWPLCVTLGSSLLVLLCGWPAFADGGHIALRANSDTYSITLFTAPDPLTAGPIDLSLLVQDPATGQVLGDATAIATLTPASSATLHTPDAGKPAPGSQPLTVTLTRAAAGNKLLLAALPVLPAPGAYTVVLRVQRPGSPAATFTATLLAAEDHRRRTTLLFALVLPLAAVLLFLVNQWAKQKRYVPGAHPPDAVN